MTSITGTAYMDLDRHANENTPKTKLHWIDWSIPPQVEIIKPRVKPVNRETWEI